MHRLGCCALLTLAASSAMAEDRVRYDDHVVVRTKIETIRQMRTMLAIGGRLWSESLGVGTLDFMLPDERLETLETLDIDFKVLVPDVQDVLDAELARLEQPEGGIAGGSFFDDYRRSDEIIAFYDALVDARPDLVSSRVIGESFEGTPIRAYTICASDPASRPALYINTGAHAREWIGPATIAYLADALVNRYDVDPRIGGLVDGIAWEIVPLANPDGYDHSWDVDRLWRKTRCVNSDGTRGVDWNRNYAAGWGGSGSSGSPSSDIFRGPEPFSEPETRAIRDDVLSLPNIAIFFDVHCYSQLVLWPYGYDNTEPAGEAGQVHRDIGEGIAASIESVNGKVFDPKPAHDLYLASGTSPDWAWDDAGVYGFTYELRDTGQFGFILPPDQIVPSGEEILESFLWTGEQVLGAAGVEFTTPLPATIDPFTDVFIDVRFKAPFSQLDPSTATLVVDDGSIARYPMVTETDGVSRAAFDSGSCGRTLDLRFEIETIDGVLLEISSDVVDGWAIDVVATEVLFEDDAEADLGWTLGLPSDDATTGVWVRVDPNGTDAQPEDDASDPGSICFVTGQGSPGGSLGENDIDGGRTTLVSPALPVGADSGTVAIECAIWYSNDTGASPNADQMLVEGRWNDGSWFELATISDNSSAWTTRRFDFPDRPLGATSAQIRFIASDFGDGSVVEAGVDDVRLLVTSCGDAPCPADLDGSGAVDGGDLGLLLSSWNSSTGGAADLDGDGVVGGGDLGLLLASWGACF